MASSAQTSQLKQYEAMDQKELSKTMTNRSYKKMINTTHITMLLLHLLPTGSPYNPTCQTICGSQNSSIYKTTITSMVNSKTTIKSIVRKIPNTMKQTSLKGVNIVTLVAVLMLHLFPTGPQFKETTI